MVNPDQRPEPPSYRTCLINYLLDVNNALENYSYVGLACSLLNQVTPSRLIIREAPAPAADIDGRVAPWSTSAKGVFQLELPPAANTVWENTWNSFSNGLVG